MRRALYAVVKNRLALLFFAVLLVVPAAHAQRRRPSLPPAVSGCPLKTLFLDAYSADVEVDDSFVYFTDSLGGVFRLNKDGSGDAQLLGTVPDFVTVLTLDGTSVYALTINIDGELGSLWSIPKAGGTPKQLAGSILTPFEMAFDATNVYWVSVGTPAGDFFLADGKVERVKKDGTGRTTLASNLNLPTHVATDGTTVYFTESGLSPASSSAGLRSVPAAGGAVTKLTSGTGAVGVTLAGSDIYFSNLDPITGGELLRMPKSGGSATSLEKGLDVVTHIVIRDDRVYYFNSDDVWSIEYVPVAGGTRKLVIGGDFVTEEFALDDCSVYYVDGNGALIRAPR